MNAVIFLALRASHVLMAAIWMGSTVFLSTQLMPAIEAAGASGGPVLMRLNQRVTTYMGLLGGTTIITGLYLLWRFTGGFSAVGSSHGAVAFCIGGTAGILAGVIGGSIVGRGAHRVAALMHQAAGMTDGPAKFELLEHVSPLRQRIEIGSRLVILLQLVALVLMAVGHYV